jgi:peptidoglycan/xylan/chitin deacetylase (PgdA/CDA1 family)
VALAERGGDVVQELWSTDRILQRATGRQPTFFRAPYGNWREKIAGTTQDKATSLVAQQLNTCGELAHYIGPVNWDISAADYDFWQQQSPAEPCAEAYWHEIERLERGIVLMHDSSEDPLVAAANQTLAVTRLLVPRLKASGYHFVGLEEVPQIHHVLADALRSS